MKHWTRWTSVCAAFLCTGFASGQSAVQDDQSVTPLTSLETRLVQSAKDAALEDVISRPWHLKLDATVYDSAGKNPQQGTIEVWQANDDNKTSYTFGASSQMELHSNGRLYISSAGNAIPDAAFQIVQQIMNPGPDRQEFAGAEPVVRKQAFGKIALDCIMLSTPMKTKDAIPLGLFPTYCLEPPTDELRVSYNMLSDAFIRQGIGKFLDHRVTTLLDIENFGTKVATGKVVALSTFVPGPDDFKPPMGVEAQQAQPEKVEAKVMAGKIIKKTPPVYPAGARTDHISGAVLLRATIGRDGRIRSLRVLSAPDPRLAISALSAVRHWEYTPFTLNGQPVNVDTTITVNYNLN